MRGEVRSEYKIFRMNTSMGGKNKLEIVGMAWETLK
jgi:hypothetical protein